MLERDRVRVANAISYPTNDRFKTQTTKRAMADVPCRYVRELEVTVRGRTADADGRRWSG